MDDASFDSPSDADCMAAAGRGDRTAFEMIARRYQQRLMRYALRSLRFEDAQDVVQDALVKAFINAAKYDPKWPVATWLFTLTRRTLVDRLRSIQRSNLTQLPPHSPAAPDNVAQHRDLHGRLWTIAAQRLSPEQVQAMWLHYVDNLPTRDVATVMERSWAWVKTALHRGRKIMAPHVAHLSENPAAAAQPRLSEVTYDIAK